MYKKTLIGLLVCIVQLSSTSHCKFTYELSPSVQLIIEKGDITHCHAQAIVNAANEQLLGGAGVCGAIFNACGPSLLQQACNRYPSYNMVRCPVGTACITDSFNLKERGIDYIIHAVGPDCRKITDPTQQDELLLQAYTNALRRADDHAIGSIAFPFISSAIYSFPKKRAAQIALRALKEYVAHNNTQIHTIHMILFCLEDFNLFCALTA